MDLENIVHIRPLADCVKRSGCHGVDLPEIVKSLICESKLGSSVEHCVTNQQERMRNLQNFNGGNDIDTSDKREWSVEVKLI